MPSKKQQESQALKAAARENGKLGGRPPKIKDNAEFLAELKKVGPPPLGNPLKLSRWYQELLTMVAWCTALGIADADIASDLRSTIRVAQQGVPPDIIAEAKRLMDVESGALDADAGPETVSAKETDAPSKPTRSISG